MINNLGIYQLVDIWDRVRRLTDSVNFNVDPASGAESNLVIQDQSISNTEITNQVNESLMRIYTELMEGRDSLFAQSIVVATQANNHGPYSFPANMFDLRWMKWKEPGVPSDQCGPQHWHPMAMVDDPNDDSIKNHFRAPTWRWEGDSFVLNSFQWNNVDNAVLINFTALPAELVKQTDVITVPARFVRVTQQAVIYDCAVNLSMSKKRNVPEELKSSQERWHSLALMTVTNAYRSSSIQTIAPDRMIQNSFSGKRPWRGGRW